MWGVMDKYMLKSTSCSNISKTVFDEVIDEGIGQQLEIMGYENINIADKYARGIAFLRFFLYSIFHSNVDISEEQIETGIVDKANDLLIDFIYIIENQIYIIQSKFNHFMKDEIIALSKIPQLIKDDSYIQKAHQDLRIILEEIRKIKSPVFNLIYITNCKIEPDLIDTFERNFSFDSITFRIKSYDQIENDYTCIQNGLYPPPEKVIVNLQNEDFFPFKKLLANYDAYIITLDGNKVLQLYSEFREELFNSNIRNWLGTKNYVNNSMLNTIREQPENFFCNNNGCTAICDDWIRIKGNKVELNNFQIINGAQTITTIANAIHENINKENFGRVKLMIKVIVPKKNPDQQLSIPDKSIIVKTTNSQNIVKTSDFRSNDPIQIYIEQQMSKFNYRVVSPFKKVTYKRKRGLLDKTNKSSKIVMNEDVGQAYYSFMENPHDLNKSIDLLWSTDSNGLYNIPFGWNGEPSDIIPQSKVIELYGIFCIFEYIKLKFKGIKKDTNPAVLFKYHILWGVSQLLKLKYDNDEQKVYAIFDGIVNTGVYVNKAVNPIKEKEFSHYIDKVIGAINYQLEYQKRIDKTFVMRNYQRSSDFTMLLGLFLTNICTKFELPDLI